MYQVKKKGALARPHLAEKLTIIRGGPGPPVRVENRAVKVDCDRANTSRR